MHEWHEQKAREDGQKIKHRAADGGKQAGHGYDQTNGRECTEQVAICDYRKERTHPNLGITD
ncbi:hypothetical protein [Burkholderia sp. ABCPW 11]|uniref:hypothetical protein n=1 Tax=Burkholderia sp. ABCPW 11 TaxID=1637859 RepID=UPI0012FD4672|nr:hypothetical protein [Burkholderia sp. ABCPW 11]